MPRAVQQFLYYQLYSTAHRPAVNQSRIKIANSDGAKKIKQYKTKFVLLITHHRAALGLLHQQLVREFRFYFVDYCKFPISSFL